MWRRKQKVLIVNHDASSIHIMRTILEKEGYKAIVALDGKEALDIMEKEYPNLVLLDIMMPKMDGFIVLNRMKEHKKLKNIPVIVVSAVCGQEYIEEAVARGAMDYMSIPFEDEELLLRVTACIRPARMRIF